MDPFRRILTRISNAELERRWTAVRRAMKTRGVDALVVQATNDWLGGAVKWLTDLPANNGYPRTVIVHADAPMTVIEMGPFGAARALGGNDPLHRGVGDLVHTPSFLSINYTHHYDLDLAVAALRSKGTKRLALYAPGALPHVLVTGLKAVWSKADAVVDMTDAIDQLKAIKSPEEQALIRATATMQDRVFAKVLATIRPGMRDLDVTTIAQAEGQALGSEQGIFLGGSARVGVRSPFVPRYMQGRALEHGDHLSLLIENNGPGGFYTEIARTIVLGKASAELQDGFAAVKAAQDHSLRLIKPGATPAAIHAAHNTFMISKGLPAELRLYAHGQGYDMVERPLIRDDETMPIAANMCLAVHPGYETASLFAVICDNYFVTETGVSECLHTTEKMIFEV